MEALCTYEIVADYSRSTGRRIIEVWNVLWYESRKIQASDKIDVCWKARTFSAYCVVSWKTLQLKSGK